MESWEVLQTAIPRTKSQRVAQILSVSADYVRRWRTEPASDDAPTASGQRSILDRITDLIDAVYLVNPAGCAGIVNFITSYYERLLEVHAAPIESHACGAEHISELLIQTTEAVNSLNIDGCTDETLRELVEMRAAVDRTIKAVETTLGAAATGSDTGV